MAFQRRCCEPRFSGSDRILKNGLSSTFTASLRQLLSPDWVGCVPNEENSYFCPDAGKVDLIYVGNGRGHLGSDKKPSRHTFDGVSDYEPIDPNIAFATVDVDHDGVDEGCEDEPVCADGIYPAPGQCNAFFQCANGIQFETQYCPPGLHFNPEQLVCDWPDNVDCGD